MQKDNAWVVYYNHAYSRARPVLQEHKGTQKIDKNTCVKIKNNNYIL